MSREYGDFQTPPGLVSAVIKALGTELGRCDRVLEPSCGSGNFVLGLLGLGKPPAEIQCIEIQPVHIRRLGQAAELATQAGVSVDIHCADLFRVDLGSDLSWRSNGPLLILGNPPWITNSELGGLESANLPEKYNIKSLPGFSARTGDANFDIAEFIWLKIITELRLDSPIIALLCKLSVARNVLQFARASRLPLEDAWIRAIDAKRWFGVSVEACLFFVRVGTKFDIESIPVYPSLEAEEPISLIGFRGNSLVGDAERYRDSAFVDGHCHLEWRQGIKHDAAGVMELVEDETGGLRNRNTDSVTVEEEFIYPLAKGTELFHGTYRPTARRVIVPQRQLTDDTAALKKSAPLLWQYLNRNRHVFERRRSSIYRGRPPFSIFGIGDYSFAQFKVGVSGLHKVPRFRIIGPQKGRPVMLDDTCYFVPCQSAEHAALVLALLDSEPVQDFLGATMFRDAKRPITKKLLKRIDLRVVLHRSSEQQVREYVGRVLDELGLGCAGDMDLDVLLDGLPLFRQTSAA